MFDYVPEMFAGDHADTIEEADQWVEEVVSGKLATVRRPRNSSPRDVVAKAINEEVKAGEAPTAERSPTSLIVVKRPS